eukprot:CAMPEP_0176457938 /NCGR_PEP_ID=MMETSP0127-20121128/32266_1 /TAXON_ID=938130 /ORGANISM="Platyophrya macrostoma, Strain WH" /LENGTH=658 /DNA_ID=CAMNT_0017848353 /DNA_START=140 /DNA_END=2116 /DNA_ORIENTATION=-
MIAVTSPQLYNHFDEHLDERLMKYFTENSQENACLSNHDATTNTKEQLESFIEGDCAPVIAVPGLMGTRLMVEIDCETLLMKHPEIMDACGWHTCTWSLFYSKPAPEYGIWIPSIFSPVSILRTTNNTCFGRLVGLHYDANKSEIHERYVEIEGLRVTWYGNTTGTYDIADGGFNAIGNILPLPVQISESKGFNGLSTYLTKLGYQKGLSLFAVPYDFRLTYKANSVPYTLERTIRYAYELTGKKVVIVAHSLGNLNTLPTLLNMSQEDKDKMIALYVAAGAPYGGASKPTRFMLGGNTEFVFENFIGFQFYNQRSIMGASSSGFDLIPKDTFFRFKNEPWMIELIERVNLESEYPPDTKRGQEFWKNYKNTSDIPLSFFPTPAEKCFSGLTERPEACMTLVTDLTKTPTAQVKDMVYMSDYNSTVKLLKNHYTYNPFPETMSKFSDALAAKVEEYGNPNVPVVYIYGSHLSTELMSYWDYHPEKLTSKDIMAPPTKIYQGLGDSTVEVSYSLPIAIKWAWEHLHKVGKAKPIKIAEYCSIKNMKFEVWDTTQPNGIKEMNTTEYVGVPCDCQGTNSTGTACTHAGMLFDTKIIEYIANLVITKEVPDLKTTAAYGLSNKELEKLAMTLPHLRRPRNDQDVKSWFPRHNEENKHTISI